MFKIGEKVKVSENATTNVGKEGYVVGLRTTVEGELGNVYVLHDGAVKSDLYQFCELETWDADAQEEEKINPAHYQTGGIDTWDYMKAKLSPTQLSGFALGNVVKYISRAEHKNKIEDLKKAQWYLNKIIEEIDNA